MADDYAHAAQRLHTFLRQRFWDGTYLVGPDQGVRFNRRVGRFIKSSLPLIPWRDRYCYIQCQGYWILDNWRWFDLTGADQWADMATRCAHGIRRLQHPDGYWTYPHPAWKNRIATVEGVFGALGLLATYERTLEPDLLAGALAWYHFMVGRVGFQTHAGGLSVNYFATDSTGLIPNNTTLALALLGQLNRFTGETPYTRQMVDFLRAVQLDSGELPYALHNPSNSSQDRVHFQCYQYNAFELQDLATYYDATRDPGVLPIISGLARFLASSVREDGSTRFDCVGHAVRVPYNTAAIAAALATARRLGLTDGDPIEDRAYAYVLAQQHPNGGFAFSDGDYGWLADRRYYPRPLSMILYHLLQAVSVRDAQPYVMKEEVLT